MPAKRKRPRHPHLNREAIAKAALDLVDRDGPSALSLRNLSHELGAGTMTLYYYVPSRDAIVRDVVALLLDEIELHAPSGATWEEGARLVARSYREMALRHPRAFELLASASNRESPVLDYARRLRSFYAGLGAPPEAFEENWSILDSFETGFLWFETRAMLRPQAGADDGRDAEASELARRLPATVSEEAFEAGLEILIEGLARRMATARGSEPGSR
ncbi:MAG: TetR/AcrR family transcriptional regulator [Deltaproteobacteria bacterium]